MTNNVDTAATLPDAEFANQNLWNYVDYGTVKEQEGQESKRYDLWTALNELRCDSEVNLSSKHCQMVCDLMYALYDGAIPLDESKWTETHKRHMNGRLYNNHAYEPLTRISAWLDIPNKLVVTLEWNKVKGVVERKYGLMAFLKKFFRTYRITHEGVFLTAEDYQFLNEYLFKGTEGMEVEIWDTPSEIYQITAIDSCMVDTDYPKFYDQAPDKVKGMVVTYKGKPISRNLLWTLDNGRRVIGRIYSSSNRASNVIKQYCAENDIDTEFQQGDYVTMPVYRGGLPWQDNMSHVVRKGNEVVLFYNRNDARNFIAKNKDCLDRVYDGCSTCGNTSDLYEEMVTCKDGSMVLEYNAVRYQDEYYNLANVPVATPENFYRLTNDTVVKHPYRSNRLIAFSELVLHEGEVILASDLTTFQGQVVHKDNMVYVGKKNDDGMFSFDGPVFLTNKQLREGQSFEWAGQSMLNFVRRKYNLDNTTRIFFPTHGDADYFYIEMAPLWRKEVRGY